MNKTELIKEREALYELLRKQWGPVPGVDVDMQDSEAVPLIMAYYDARLIKYYNGNNQEKIGYQNARRIYKSLLKKVNVNLEKTENSNKVLRNELEEIQLFLIDKIANFSNEIRVSGIQKWIFNLYQILLISLKRRDPYEREFFSVMTRFEKRFRNNLELRELNHLSLKETAEKKNRVLPDTLNSLKNPFKIIFVNDELEWLLDFFVNFEMLYQEQISKNIFLYDQSDEKQENAKIDKLKKMIDRTYNEYFLKKRLDIFEKKYCLFFDKEKNKYCYRES